MKILTYPALITPDENNTFGIEFVDVPEAFSFGKSINEAVIHGQEALGLALIGMKTVPAATPIDKIQTGNNQTVVLVSVDLEQIKAKVKETTVRKNVTVPQEIAQQAEAKNINFSATLTEALKEKLEA